MADNTLDTKPMPMQDGTFFGEEPMFRLLDDLLSEGIVAAADLLVTASGTDVSVNVDAGNAYVEINSPYGGKRRVKKTASSNSGTPGAPNTPGWETTFATPDATNPRIDRVVLTVYDNLIDSSGKYAARLRVIQGSAIAGASLTNLNGAAAVPNNSLLLANVLIRNGTASIIGSDVDSVSSNTVRPRALVGAGAALGGAVIATSVVGLGGGVPGKRGLIRVGSSPFTYVELIYDATLAKWVSEPIHWDAEGNNNVVGSGEFSGTSSGNGALQIRDFKALWDAGLRPQVFISGRQGSGVATASVSLILYDYDDGDAAYVSIGTLVSLSLNGTATYKISPWTDYTTPAPTQAHGRLSLAWSAATNTAFSFASAGFRWVST